MTEINEKLQLKIDAVKQLLEQIEADYSPAVLATSYGAEDMVLMDLIAKFAPQIGIFTLDTGRLPKETYDLMQQAKKHYQLEVEVYYPDTLSIEQFVTHTGPNAFYDSVDLRKQCCGIRKVAPLNTEGTPWDVAWAAVFLASDESRWISGVTIPVDGGLLAEQPLHGYDLLEFDGAMAEFYRRNDGS